MRLCYGNSLYKPDLSSMCTCPRTESQCSTKVLELISVCPMNLMPPELGTVHFYHCDVSGYGFVEFLSEDDADYSIKIMNMIKLFGKPVNANQTLESCFSSSNVQITTEVYDFRLTLPSR